MKVLVIDVGGTNIKLLATGGRAPVKLDSGRTLTAAAMVKRVLAATEGWQYEAVTIGYPGPVVRGRPVAEPPNLGGGWVRFNFARALGCPVLVMNDAAMQALGSYRGGRMLFLGLGTGLGTTTIFEGVVNPLEAAHLPYREGKSFEDYLGLRGLKRLGRLKWERHVHKVAGILRRAFVADYVVLGGGNAKLLRTLPPHARRGDNAHAFRGGFRIWEAAHRPVSGLPAARRAAR